MKKILFGLLIFSAVMMLAQEKTLIAVKSSSTTSGVIVVTIRQDNKPLELQCTQTAPYCVAPQAGDYWMVKLPPNHGLYDCDNVDLYAHGADPDTAQKIGEFCLNSK